MWSFIKGIFGGKDTTSKTLEVVSSSVKGIGNWIDEKDFTPEEKAKSWAKAVDAHLELVKATAGENGPRSVTRRWLAWGITGFILFWASVAMFIGILGAFGAVDINQANAAISGIVSIAETFWLGIAFTAVVGFYFGVQLFRK